MSHCLSHRNILFDQHAVADANQQGSGGGAEPQVFPGFFVEGFGVTEEIAEQAVLPAKSAADCFGKEIGVKQAREEQIGPECAGHLTGGDVVFVDPEMAVKFSFEVERIETVMKQFLVAELFEDGSNFVTGSGARDERPTDFS